MDIPLNPRQRCGVTLVELLLAIVLLGIAVPVVLNLGATVARFSAQTVNLARATSRGKDLLEEILSKRFDERLSPVGGNWSALGPDGEMAPPTSSYDDVDDYHGWSDVGSGVHIGLNRSVQVTYLEAVGLQLNPTASTSHSYKRVTVTVTGPAGVSVDLVGLATTANSQGAS